MGTTRKKKWLNWRETMGWNGVLYCQTTGKGTCIVFIYLFIYLLLHVTPECTVIEWKPYLIVVLSILQIRWTDDPSEIIVRFLLFFFAVFFGWDGMKLKYTLCGQSLSKLFQAETTSDVISHVWLHPGLKKLVNHSSTKWLRNPGFHWVFQSIVYCWEQLRENRYSTAWLGLPRWQPKLASWCPLLQGAGIRGFSQMSAAPTPFPMPLCAKYLGTTAPSQFDAFKKIYEHFSWQKNKSH